MSWIRSLDGSFDRSVDFYYSVRREAAALRATVVETEREGLLTAEKVANGHFRSTEEWVYMCGPPPMMTALGKGFRALGIPASRLRWEQFDIR
jgi:predicted ferric reductase